MRKLFLFWALLLVGGGISAQKIHNEIEARNHINALKSSALLVRLKTKSKTIDALKERGMDERAAEIQAEQKEQNLEIIKAFKGEFNFCKVYFFYSDDSKYIMNKQWNQVSFLNENLEADTSIRFDEDIFYTAEFSQVDLRVDKTQGTPQWGFEGLIIKDSNFNQLGRPFPFYVRNFNSLPIRKKPSKVVRKMNSRLKEFYG